MSIFALLGAADRIIGNRFGLGKEFEKGIMFLGPLALSMIGMIVISPFLAHLVRPILELCSGCLPFDASIVPASLFANDMGGASLAVELMSDESIGNFNALVVSSMLGCTISFTIPVSLECMRKERHREVIVGILCGLVTIPLGCLVAGFVSGLKFIPLLLNTIPIAVFSGLIAIGLLKAPEVCIKVFSIFGVVIKVLITVGLALGIFTYLTGVELLRPLASFESGAKICFNASAVMAGAFPLMHLVGLALRRPLQKFGRKVGISDLSAMGIVTSMASSMITFGNMGEMDKKGVVVNCAFAVSGAFTFAGHLAFTLAFNGAYVWAVIIGKLLAGFSAIAVSLMFYEKLYGKSES